jgi:hypothetical protein
MATIKSYTDIEQSKKLAEILPLESADMYYPWYIEENGDTIGSGHRISIPSVGSLATHKVNKRILSCWSLAALLSVLPNGIVMYKDSQNGKYHFSFTHTGTCVTADNPVDACYKLILKLHELML